MLRKKLYIYVNLSDNLERSKLIRILKTLTPWEWHSFSDYVHSPYFNKHEKVLGLFLWLRDRQDSLTGEQLEMETVFRDIFPGEAFHHQKLRYVMTDLTRLLEDWLVDKQMQDRPWVKHHMLLYSYILRDQEKYFRMSLDRSLKALEKSPYRDGSYYEGSFRVEEDAFLFAQAKENRAHDRSPLQLLGSLDRFYLIHKLKYLCEILNRKNILNITAEAAHWEETVRYIHALGLQDEPGVAIYYQILLTITEGGSDKPYQALKQLLDEHSALFPKDELGNMYSFALNYCIRQLNNGQTKFLNELFELYQQLVEKELVYQEEYIVPQHFKNIVTVGVRIKEFQWIEDFIQSHRELLPPAIRENAYTYNLAYLYYAQGAYSRTLKLLQQVEFEDVFYSLDSRALLLKTYYELGEWEPLISLIESFKIYLRRNKRISDYQRKVYLNLVKFTRKLVRQRLGSRKPVSEVHKEVQAQPEIADLNWLMGKLEEIS